MTVHVHDPAAHRGSAPDAVRPARASVASTRPRWLLPAVVGAIVAGALVFAGVISLSTLLYAGLVGGMILMHAGGHGHGGHGGHGSGTDANLRPRSSGVQDVDSGSNDEPDERAAATTTGEVDRHDQHSSHGCH